ncbi:hypothetical protein IT072_02475 [Leifsonia sp. ZF2019]|uniref:hypothetical protein n=1 Tax=Leifsonia sp. ZF2019 TaxID=2781978 RepID=UPI001CBE44F1|nr:hypothetical protein [Leifsonia sp. ZF2019]UAJ79963.1 hypothetical protein IT072_02475 [Leifsonia sp. ZF2019]
MEALTCTEGDLIMLSRGEAHIMGRYERVTQFGFTSEPMLVMNPDLCDGYNVDVMVNRLGWSLTILETAE